MQHTAEDRPGSRRGLARRAALAVVFLLAGLFTSTVGGQERRPGVRLTVVSGPAGEGSVLTIESDAFAEGAGIPKKYTCDGPDLSPPLRWKGVPRETKSLALIMDDPDAPRGTWVHWVLYNAPPTADGLAEGTPRKELLPDGARQGVNDFGKIGYGGPCPPRGAPHRYFFRLYALDIAVEIKGARATRADLDKAIKGHVLATATLMGRYGR